MCPLGLFGLNRSGKSPPLGLSSACGGDLPAALASPLGVRPCWLSSSAGRCFSLSLASRAAGRRTRTEVPAVDRAPQPRSQPPGLAWPTPRLSLGRDQPTHRAGPNLAERPPWSN